MTGVVLRWAAEERSRAVLFILMGERLTLTLTGCFLVELGVVEEDRGVARVEEQLVVELEEPEEEWNTIIIIIIKRWK